MTDYTMLTSEDGGVTWVTRGVQSAQSRESALSKFFPSSGRTIGHQYNAVAASHWQPVEWATREQAYTRKVTGLVDANQTTLLDELASGSQDAPSQSLQDEVDGLAADLPADVVAAEAEEEIPA